MKIPVPARDGAARFNLTPLIDICFNLIVFFALASVCLRNETAQAVSLPSATKADPRDAMSPRRFVITLNAQGSLFVQGKEMSWVAVENLLSQKSSDSPDPVEVRIRCDRRVPYARVKPLVMACARLGLDDLKFAVDAP